MRRSAQAKIRSVKANTNLPAKNRQGLGWGTFVQSPMTCTKPGARIIVDEPNLRTHVGLLF